MNPDPSSILINPRTFDAAERISVLRQMLQEDTVEAGQRKNIATVIGLYENGELPNPVGEMVWLQDGKVCSKSDIDGQTPWWVEVSRFQNNSISGLFAHPSQGGGIQLMDRPRESTQ